MKGSSPSYFPVIDQPSALTSQRTDGVLQLRFECCFVLNSITRDEESMVHPCHRGPALIASYTAMLDFEVKSIDRVYYAKPGPERTRIASVQAGGNTP